MRVLHCIPTLTGGGYGSFIGGGAERQCAYLCSELSRLGVEIHIAALRYGTGPETDLLANVATLHVLGHKPAGDVRKAQRDIRIPFRLSRLIRAIDPDVVQSWNRPMDLFAGLAAACQGRPWVLSERNTGAMYHGIAERARRLMGRWATMIIANSAGGQSYWKRYARPGTRRELIPNMVPSKSIRLELEGSPLKLPDTPPVRILYVGRFHPQKNIHVMIEGLCQAAESGLSCKITLLGDGPQRESAEKMVSERGLAAKFDFKGYNDRPWEEMRQASMLLLVSRFEGHPNVVCEAMAIGCPVIISNIAAHRALFSDQNALFIDPDSPHDIASAIKKVVADPDGALRRAEEAKRLVLQWSPETIARRYLALYETLCNGNSAQGEMLAGSQDSSGARFTKVTV